MKVFHLIIHALSAILAYKLRTLFSILSIALGVAAITLIVGATEGAYKRAYDIVDRFGPDSALIISGSRKQRSIGIRKKVLTFDDMKEIKARFPTAYLIVPMTTKPDAVVSFKGRHHQTLVIGATENYSKTWTWPILIGRDITAEEVQGARNICLLGLVVKERLFGEENPIGKYIFVDHIPVRVIGVLSKRGMTGSGHNLDDRIVMPITSVMRKMLNETRYIAAIRMRFSDANNVEKHIEEIREILRRRHNIREAEDDDFFIVTPKEIVKFLVKLSRSFVVFLAIVGGTALAVSGFVIANLFLLSVKERTTEIGIRRAVGAKRANIRFQFMIEVFITVTAGAILGFLFGIGASEALRSFAQFPMYLSYKAFFISVGISWVVAALAGLKPARAASMLHPVEAIRSGL